MKDSKRPESEKLTTDSASVAMASTAAAAVAAPPCVRLVELRPGSDQRNVSLAVEEGSEGTGRIRGFLMTLEEAEGGAFRPNMKTYERQRAKDDDKEKGPSRVTVSHVLNVLLCRL